MQTGRRCRALEMSGNNSTQLLSQRSQGWGQPGLCREEEDRAFSEAAVWNTPIISAFGKLRQEDSEFNVSLRTEITPF